MLVMAACRAAPAAAQLASEPLSYEAAALRLREVSDALAGSAAQTRAREAQAGALKTLCRPEVSIDVREVDYQKSISLSTGAIGPSLGLPAELDLAVGGWAFRPIVSAVMPLYTGGQIGAAQMPRVRRCGRPRPARPTSVMDADLFPNVIDYWGPTGMVFVCNPQLRLTVANMPRLSVALAIEHANTDVDLGQIRELDPTLGANIRDVTPLPDLTGQARHVATWGHVQVSGLLTKLAYETLDSPDNQPRDSRTGGGATSGRASTWPRRAPCASPSSMVAASPAT
jgi:hypothetical protein